MMPLGIWEVYHAPTDRSVADFTVVQRRKGALFFCGAKCRLLALFDIRDLSAIWSRAGNSRHRSAPAPNGLEAFDPSRKLSSYLLRCDEATSGRYDASERQSGRGWTPHGGVAVARRPATT